jgi:hypothetical protein
MVGFYYLCYRSRDVWQCKKFNSFLDADNHYYANKLCMKTTTIIPVSRMIPEMFHKEILQNKLKLASCKVAIE